MTKNKREYSPAARRENSTRPARRLSSGVNKYLAAVVIGELVEEKILKINGRGGVSYAGN